MQWSNGQTHGRLVGVFWCGWACGYVGGWTNSRYTAFDNSEFKSGHSSRWVCIAANMSAADAKPESVAGAKSNLNTASLKELMKVEQIGEILAKRIQSNALFSNWEEVAKVKAVGPVRLKNLHRSFRIDIAKQTGAPTDAAAPSGDGENSGSCCCCWRATCYDYCTCHQSFHRRPLIHVSIQGRRNVTNASS